MKLPLITAWKAKKLRRERDRLRKAIDAAKAKHQEWKPMLGRLQDVTHQLLRMEV